MATHPTTNRRWVQAQLAVRKDREFDSERDLFPLFEAIGKAWLFDADDLRLIHRKPNLRPLWKENLSTVLRDLSKSGAITPISNRGGSRYAIN